MKSSRLLSALVVPAVTLALISCSTVDDDAAESPSKALSATEAPQAESASEEASESQERTPEEVARVFNKFYAELSDEDRSKELGRLEGQYWNTVGELGPMREITADDWQAMNEAAEQVFGDLLVYFDTSELSQDEIYFLLTNISQSNVMYSAFGPDVIPEANLSPEDVTVEGDTATFNSVEAFDFGNITPDDGTNTAGEDLVTMVYKDGKWLFTPDFLEYDPDGVVLGGSFVSDE